MLRFFNALFLICNFAYGQTDCEIDLSTEDKIEHFDKEFTVCRRIDQITSKERINGSPTFLNLNGTFPYQKLTIVIWREDLHSFRQGVEHLLHKRIKILGEIKKYKNNPQIIIKRPSEITIIE